MSLIIEDGSIVAGSNSYASTADLELYAGRIGHTLKTNKLELLFRAMQYVEGLDFIGSKFTKDQSLQWPRSSVRIDGFYITESEIPRKLIDLQLSVAVSIDKDVDPLAVQERVASSETVGPITVQYEAGTAAQATSPTIRAYEAGLVRGGGGLSVKLTRA